MAAADGAFNMPFHVTTSICVLRNSAILSFPFLSFPRADKTAPLLFHSVKRQTILLVKGESLGGKGLKLGSPLGSIAQLVERRTGIPKMRVQIPLGPTIFPLTSQYRFIMFTTPLLRIIIHTPEHTILTNIATP